METLTQPETTQPETTEMTELLPANIPGRTMLVIMSAQQLLELWLGGTRPLHVYLANTWQRLREVMLLGDGRILLATKSGVAKKRADLRVRVRLPLRTDKRFMPSKIAEVNV